MRRSILPDVVAAIVVVGVALGAACADGGKPVTGPTSPNTPGSPGGSAPQPAVDSTGIWISAREIAALPMSGPAWTNVKSRADQACGTPDIANQDSNVDTCVLAKALVFVRTGVTSYRDSVVAALRYLAGSGTYSGSALALGRNLTGYVLGADLVGLKSLDPTLDAAFRAYIDQLRTTPTSPGSANLVACHELRPNNWGLHCGTALLTVALYLGRDSDVVQIAQMFKGWLGDRSAYAGFKYGDLSWQADSSAPVGIDPKGATLQGDDVDGVLPDDQRRCGSFVWPPCQTNYEWEAMQGALATAWILYRRGYDTFGWSDQALLRAATWLYNVDLYPVQGDDGWQPYILNHVYHTSFAAPSPAQPGKSVGYTDWTLAR